MPELSDASLAKLISHRQASKFQVRTGLLQEFRAICCDIDSDGVMGLTKWPVPFLLVPSEVCVDYSFSWSMVGSYAPGSTVTTWSVDMGDGTVYTTETGTHTYSTTGVKTIQATVTAANGQSRVATAQTNVIDCDDYVPPENPPPGGEDSIVYAMTFDKVAGPYWTTDRCVTWTNRANGLNLTDVRLLGGLIKKGWQTIQGTEDPEQVIAFCCGGDSENEGGAGFMARTLNSGGLWESILPDLDDPDLLWYPDGLGTSPGTADEGVLWKTLACNNAVDGVLYAIGDYYDGNDRIFVLVRSPDMGTTWTIGRIMKSSCGSSGVGWHYPTDVDLYDAYGSANIWHAPPTYDCGPGAARFSEYVISGAGPDALGADDDVFVTFTLEQYDCNENYLPGVYGHGAVTADFGTTITDIQQVQIKSGTISGDWSAVNLGSPGFYTIDGYNVSVEANSPYGVTTMAPVGWSHRGSPQWLPAGGVAWRDTWIAGGGAPGQRVGAPWDQPFSAQFLHYKGEMTESLFPDVGADGVRGVDAIRVYGNKASSGMTDASALDMWVDFETGENIWVTIEDCDGHIEFYSFDPDLELPTPGIDMTSVHGYYVSGGIRGVYKPTVENYGDIVYVYGAIGGGPIACILESTDGGGSFASVWASVVGVVQSLLAEGDGSGQLGDFYAFLTDLSIYRGDSPGWVMSNIGSAPFLADFRSLAQSVGYDTNLTMLICNTEAGALAAELAQEPYDTYTNVTDGLPGGGIVHAEWITPWEV